jgi:hypothetical protein
MDILRDLWAWKHATDEDRQAAARRCVDLLGHGWALLGIVRPVRRAAPCPRCRGEGNLDTREKIHHPARIGTCDTCSGAGWPMVDVGVSTALFSRHGSSPLILLPGRDGSAPLLVAKQAVDLEGLRRPTPAEWARIVEPTDPTIGHLLGLESPADANRSVATVALPPDEVPPGDLGVLLTEGAWILQGKEEVVAALHRFAAREAATVELVEIRPSPLTFDPCPCNGSGCEIDWESGGAFLHYEEADRSSLARCTTCEGSGTYWEEREVPVGVFRRRADGRLLRLRHGDPPTLVPMA